MIVITLVLLGWGQATAASSPFLFFFNQPNPNCGRGVVTCRGVLANYLNAVDSIYIRVVARGEGRVVHFPADVVANNATSVCDSYLTAGYLGPLAARVNQGSHPWTDRGTEGVLFYLQSPSSDNVLASCAQPPKSEDGVVPGCAGGESFYQLVFQLAYELPLTVEVSWTITTVDLLTASGTSDCLGSPNQPSYEFTAVPLVGTPAPWAPGGSSGGIVVAGVNLSVGAIVGIVVGAVVGALLVVGLIALWLRKRRGGGGLRKGKFDKDLEEDFLAAGRAALEAS